MEKKILVSWDIDGTMILFENNVSTHHDAFAQAFSELFKETKGPNYILPQKVYGMMDRKIVHDCIEILGFEPTEENIQKGMQRTEEIFKEKFTQIPLIPPGVERCLKELSEMPNVTLAVASGNLEGIAWKKLSSGGLDKYFKDKIGGFGGYVDSRDEAIKLARVNAEKVKGYKFDKVFHVGDMPTDVESAHKAGATAIAVLTGYSDGAKFEEPVYVFENLEKCHDEFMKLITE